jgi:two-component system response regulator FixJ
MKTVHVVASTQNGRHDASEVLISIGHDFTLHHSILELLESLEDFSPGCVLLGDCHDLFMDDSAPREEIVSRRGTLPLIVAVKSREVSLAVRAMKAGAFGIIEHPYDADDLKELIEAAMVRANEANRARLERAEEERKLNSLSRRELEILRLIAEGRPNKVAAHQLGISPRTAEIHRANVMRKLSCQNVSQIIRLALRSGFCSPWEAFV